MRTGGRAKGVPNKRSKEAARRLRKLKFDPLAALVEVAKDPAHPERVRAAAELMRYRYPQLKATEISGELTAPQPLVVQLPPLTPDQGGPQLSPAELSPEEREEAAGGSAAAS